jgi:hypothetical protein
MEDPMALLALSFPIVPGKTEQWLKFTADLKGPRRADFVASRKRMGVRERTFLQKTPKGDFVLVTLEGEDPAGAFQKWVAGTDDFTKWFITTVSALHGMDFTKPLPGMPELIIDSQG